MSRPEGTVPPELFYNEKEAKKYSVSSRMIDIQTEIAQRALDMLALPEDKPAYILDIGCGSGLSGNVLEQNGHYWVGCDISRDMLNEAIADNGGVGSTETTGDYVKSDMGMGLPFRPGTFDGVISVSAIQWLCYSDSSDQDPNVRLNRFFGSLYSILKKDGRACLQFYPENAAQAVLVSQIASKVGFTGGVVVDYPNSTKAKKYYLCLSFERGYQVPTSLINTNSNPNIPSGHSTVKVMKSKFDKPLRKGKQRLEKHSKEWVMQKKESRRAKGKEVKEDSKYSGRKRRSKVF